MQWPGTVQRGGKPVETPDDNVPPTQLSGYHCRVQRNTQPRVAAHNERIDRPATPDVFST